jgi:ATP-dependent Lon protease
MGGVTLNGILEKRFHEIILNFKKASRRHNITFNEDIFMDTYIKCCERLNEKDLDENQIIQYFWVSFVNNTKKSYRNNKITVDIDEYEEVLDIIDEPYDDRRLRVYDIITKYVETKFPDDYKMWYLHFAENKSYNELKKLGYENVNFHNVFRNINNYIKNNLPKQNKEYKTIINEIFRKTK